MKSYRLLRNNKEIGPFSLEELIATQLKPYDLVWIDGKSAAWRYPSEILELQPYASVVEEQPFDRFFTEKKTEIAESIKKEAITVIPKQITQKPRFKVTAWSEKIDSTRDVIISSEQEQQPSEKTIKILHSLRVTATLLQKASFQVNDETKQITLETKYSSSLDNIKKRYEATVLAKKKSIHRNYAWLLVLPVFVVGLWMGMRFTSSKPGSNLIQPVTEKPLPQTSKETSIEYEVPANVEAQIQQPLSKENDNLQISNIKTQGSSLLITKSVAIIEKELTSSKPVTNTHSEEQKEEKDMAVALSRKASEIETKIKLISQKILTPSYQRRMENYVTIDGQYKKPENGISDLKLTIDNIAPFPLDLVAIDIQYFDKNGALQKGETLYAKNIPPRRNVSLQAPDGYGTAKVGYKVAMISADKAGVHLVAD